MIRLGAFAARMLVPALLLPAAAFAAAVVGDQQRPTSGSVWLIAATVYLFVLLGSMTLNAWLLLRHPATFTDSELPSRLATAQSAQWGLVVVWGLVLLGGEPAVPSLVVAAAIAGLSIYIFVEQFRRPRAWVAVVARPHRAAAGVPRAARSGKPRARRRAVVVARPQGRSRELVLSAEGFPRRRYVTLGGCPSTIAAAPR